MLSKKRFYKFISNYSPLSWERISPEDKRYNTKIKNMHYPLINRDRFYFSLKYALKHFQKHNLVVLDLGPYPGTLLRILRKFLYDYNLKLYGAGLHINSEFLDAMKDVVANIMAVNLDPSSQPLKNKNYPTVIPLQNESVDFIFALDVIEHLTSPIHMLAEAKRVLKREGKILIVTPNITRIGSLFKLLAGRSNLEGIIPIDYYNQDDEWRPHFREYSMGELERLLTQLDFKVIDKVFFNSNLTHFDVKTIKQRLVDIAKFSFYCVPHSREHLLIVGKKLS